MFKELFEAKSLNVRSGHSPRNDRRWLKGTNQKYMLSGLRLKTLNSFVIQCEYVFIKHNFIMNKKKYTGAWGAKSVYFDRFDI